MKKIIIRTVEALTTRNLTILFVMAIATVLIIQRTVFGFEFPIPWNDEVAFIAQAFSLSTENTLYVWGLNKDQVVMWMPPGYMALLALLYKIFGYSFELTRWVSSILYFMSVLTILHIARTALKGNILLFALSLLLMLITFLSPYSLTIANIARMESFYFMLFSLSLLFAIKKLPALALAIIIASATVHYNAIYFLFPLGVFVAWTITTRKNIVIRPVELLALCIAAIIIAAYLLLISNNIHSFIQDIHFQFEWKKIGETMSGRKGWITLGILSLIPTGIVAVYREFNSSVWLSLYGISFIAMALNGHNMWYSFAFQTGYLLIIISLLIIITHCTAIIKTAGLLLICMPLFFQQLNYSWGQHDQFSPILQLIKNPQQSFLSKETLNKAKQQLLELPPESTISFGYTGIESFFFNELHQAGLKWSIPGNSVTQLHPVRTIDYRLHCDSSLFPAYLFVYDWDGYPRKGEDTGCKLVDLRIDKTNAP